MLDAPTRSERLGGWTLVAFVVLVMAHQIRPAVPLEAAGVLGWTAALLLWRRLSAKQRIPVLAMLLLGAAGIIAGAPLGEEALVRQALTQNNALVAMLIAVSFLQLVTLARPTEEALPHGRRALGRTLLGVHLFGGVINLSTVLIVGERIALGARLGRSQVIALSRSFGAAAFWSPFWAAMATALSFAPGANFAKLMGVGVPFAALGLFFTWLDLTCGDPARGEGFRGYPMHLDSLALPLSLAAGVIALHALIPGWSVLSGVTLLAPLAAVALLLLRSGPGAAARHLSRHVTTRLSGMAGEVHLFLSAAVFASGLGAVLKLLGPGLPFHGFGPLEASLVLGLIVALSLVGIHPVISVATASAWLAPVAPHQDLLALTILMAWGIATPCNPFSGLALALQGRFGVQGRKLLAWNAAYALRMVAAGAVVLWLFAALIL